MNRGSALIPLVLLLVLLILSAGYFYVRNFGVFSHDQLSGNASIFSQTKTPVSNTKIYTNSELKFKFDYSNDLSVLSETEDSYNKREGGDFRSNFAGYVGYQPGVFVGAVVVLDKTRSYRDNPFTVWVFDNPNNLSVDVWYGNYWYFPFVWGDFTYNGKIKIAPTGEATVSGKPAQTGIVDYQPGKPKFVYLSKDQKIYLFRIIGAPGEKILSTFKFTN